MTRITRNKRALVVTMAATLILSSCGGDATDDTASDSTAPSDVATTPANDTPPTTAPPAPPSTTEDANFVEIDPPVDLTGNEWFITEYQYKPNSTGITNTLGEDTVLVFNEDGTLTGHNGCNEFAGRWEITGPYYDYDEAAEAFEDKIDGQPISITADLTTEVECSGFVGDQDFDLMGALTSAEIWYVGNVIGDDVGGITLHSETGDIFADPR